MVRFVNKPTALACGGRGGTWTHNPQLMNLLLCHWATLPPQAQNAKRYLNPRSSRNFDVRDGALTKIPLKAKQLAFRHWATLAKALDKQSIL